MLRVIIIIISIFTVTQINAQTSDIEQVFRDKITSVSAENKTIQCNFTQTKKVKNIKNPTVSSGTFFYDNAGRMALIYNRPQGDKIIMNSDIFTIIIAGKKIDSKASSNPMMAQISYMMQACMSGDISKFGRGWEMNIEELSKGYQVTITPTNRRIKKHITGMLMRFNNTDLTLDMLRMNEASGGYAEYTFFNKEINSKFDNSVFNAE